MPHFVRSRVYEAEVLRLGIVSQQSDILDGRHITLGGSLDWAPPPARLSSLPSDGDPVQEQRTIGSRYKDVEAEKTDLRYEIAR